MYVCVCVDVACMREQLAQALSTQQTLMVERDQAREQLKLAQDRGNRLQKQLDTLRLAFGKLAAKKKSPILKKKFFFHFCRQHGKVLQHVTTCMYIHTCP